METSSSSDAWERWLAANAARFLLFARERTTCEADAEDVLQEALVEAWERTPGQRLPDVPLVFATIRRRALDLARSRHRRARREQLASADHPPAWFSSAVEDAETRALLESSVRGLPENLREAVTLRIWGGLTFAQMADAVRCPLNTAAARYRYGIDALRKRLKGAMT